MAGARILGYSMFFPDDRVLHLQAAIRLELRGPVTPARSGLGIEHGPLGRHLGIDGRLGRGSGLALGPPGRMHGLDGHLGRFLRLHLGRPFARGLAYVN